MRRPSGPARSAATTTLVALLAAMSPATAAGQGTPDASQLVEYAAPLDPVACAIGQVLPDLPFTDLAGKAGHLSDFAGQKALVIVVRDVGCPVSKKYGLRTGQIEAAYAPRGVAFLYVDTSKQDSPDECAAEAKEYGFAGRYARDLTGRFGRALRVRTTTDVFVVDPARRLVYRGPIDDQIGRGATRVAATKECLKDALEAVLAGQPVAAPALAAPGCFLEFPPEPAQELTWHGAVERIVQQRCLPCHRDGGAGPFAFDEPDDLAGRAPMIRKVLRERIMPPWFASDACGPFTNENCMPAAERNDLLAWLDNGAPVGDPRSAPPPRTFPTGWTIGEPDLVLANPKAVAIPATGVVDYLDVYIETGLDHDVWLQAIQVRCQNPGICHHVIVQSKNPANNVADFVDSYLPGKPATIYPEGMAMLLPKHATIHLNLHYTPNGKPCEEVTSIGFRFAKQVPDLQVQGRVVRNYNFEIGANVPHFEVISEYTLPYDVELRRVIPHMHLRGKSSRVELVAPDGTKTLALDLTSWDPNWQFAYELATPIPVAEGTTVRCLSVYDNSAANPFNPDPGKKVYQGAQIWNEMAGAFLEWTRPTPRRLRRGE